MKQGSGTLGSAPPHHWLSLWEVKGPNPVGRPPPLPDPRVSTRSWGKPLEHKTSPNRPERLLAANHEWCRLFTRIKEITGSTQTRSRRSSRPAVGVAAGYCCRIAAPPRRRRQQRGHWSCVRACERVGRYIYTWLRELAVAARSPWTSAPREHESEEGDNCTTFQTSYPHRLSPRAIRGNRTRVRVVVFIDKKHSWNHFITPR